MHSYSSLLAKIERRVRRLSGLRIATIALFVGAFAALGIAGAQWFRLLSLDAPATGLLFGVPFLCALAAYCVGVRKRRPIPGILLSLDTALQTSERLSSLYELYLLGDRGPFRTQLEEKVRVVAAEWRRGLPIGRGVLIRFLASVLALVACVPLLATVPSPALIVEPMASVEGAPITARSSSPAGETGAALSGIDASSAPDRTASGDAPAQTLEDELGGLWRSDDAPAILGGDGLGEGGETPAPSQGQLAEEMLRQIEERLRQQGGGLTPAERRALENLARQLGGDSALGQALESLLSQEEGTDLTDELAQARELARAPDAAPPPEGHASEASGAPGDTEQDGDESGLAWQPPAGDSAGEPSSDREPSLGESQDAAAGDDQEAPGKPRDWDEDRFGGVEGAPGEAVPLASPPGFLPLDLAAPFGPSGPLREFMTKGVPLETAPSDAGSAAQLVVDYDALRALLDARPLSPTTQDLVKTYFQAITQGGR